MARKIRIQFSDACYHVINRGNYRGNIFDTSGARYSFLKCLAEVCSAKGWLLHAWVLMRNHYHLCIQTPEPNLVDGMAWLQSTFANRFNRFRKENGHVFQGRYKAILLDGSAVGAVCHYIHLNPVRAGMMSVSELEKYTDSSFHQIWYPSKRARFLQPLTALNAAGGLADTVKGRQKYRDYLSWLSEEDEEQKRIGFQSMCRGWVKGTKDFRQTVLEDLKSEDLRKVVEADAREILQSEWELCVKNELKALGKTEADLISSAKGIEWKVTLARHLRETKLVPNGWLAMRLNMGTAKSLSSRLSAQRKASDPRACRA